MAIDIERLEILMSNCCHSFYVTHLIEDRLRDSLRNKLINLDIYYVGEI